MIAEHRLELFKLPWRRMRSKALSYAIFSPYVTMEVVRTARRLRA